MNRLLHSMALKVGVYLLAWTLPALISTTQLRLSYSLRGDSAPLLLLLQVTVPTWYAWAMLAPLIYLASRRFPLDSARWRQSLGVHLALNSVLLVAAVAVVFVARRLLGTPFSSFTVALISGINASLLAYWTTVLVAHAVRYWQEVRARALREAELSAQLSSAKLEALRAQLHPHFLFNTMHAISAFLHEEPGKAETMLAQLADLLRLALDTGASATVPLEAEMDFIGRYLALQKARLGERLVVEIDVPEDLSGAEVPAMLLQPIVENAVEHGIAARRGPGSVRVSAQRDGDRLHLEVRDDGLGLDEDARGPGGWRVGLRNTRARLAQLYGAQQEMLLQDIETGGVAVRVTIPYLGHQEANR